MLRGSLLYHSPVRGSLMLQIMLKVFSFMNGSIQAVFGSGTIAMSDSLIAFQPRIEDPSKGTPSVKESSSI